MEVKLGLPLPILILGGSIDTHYGSEVGIASANADLGGLIDTHYGSEVASANADPSWGVN